MSKHINIRPLQQLIYIMIAYNRNTTNNMIHNDTIK